MSIFPYFPLYLLSALFLFDTEREPPLEPVGLPGPALPLPLLLIL